MLKFSLLDRVLIQIDNMWRRPKNLNNYPAENLVESPLQDKDRANSISMLRINHSGEICAQALYQGQALFARSNQQYMSLMQAAVEENDHLNWCRQRLFEINGKTSILNPLWYTGSILIGMAASLAGDKLSLGFLAETEYQVTEHLQKHLKQISKDDQRSRAVLEQMKIEELEHATSAVKAGGTKLPISMRLLMRATSKILTKTAAKI